MAANSSRRPVRADNGFLGSREQGTQSALGSESKAEWSLRPRPLTYRSCPDDIVFSPRGLLSPPFGGEMEKNLQNTALYTCRTRKICLLLLPRCRDLRPFTVNPRAPSLCLGVPHPFSDSLFRARRWASFRIRHSSTSRFPAPTAHLRSTVPDLLSPVRLSRGKKRGTSRPDLSLPCLPPT